MGELVLLKSETMTIQGSDDTIVKSIYYKLAIFSAEPRFIQFNDRIKTERITPEKTFTRWDDLKVTLHEDEELEVTPGVFWGFTQTLDYLLTNGSAGLVNGNLYILELKGY